jgi:hypothetical protein
VDHDLIVEGYCAPDLPDREFTRFAWYSWFPIRKEIPLVLKHDLNRTVGRILETRIDKDKGLYVRALITDSSAKSLSYFSVAATILSWRIEHAEDPKRVVALVTPAVLDHIGITNNPAQAAAKILLRDRPPPALVAYDLARAGVLNMMKQLDFIRQLSAQPTPTPACVPRHPHAEALLRRSQAPPPRVARPTDFSRLAAHLNARGAEP